MYCDGHMHHIKYMYTLSNIFSVDIIVTMYVKISGNLV